jgi:hypothetical protein
MLDHFSALEEVEIHGAMVEIFEPSVPNEELGEFLRPQMVLVYNQYYVPPEEPIARAGLPRVQELLTSHMPTSANLKKAEFGEVLATLFLRDVKERMVPVYKHSHKTARNMPVHGFDCLAFIIPAEAGSESHLTACFCEVKTTESETPYPTVCYEIRHAFEDVTPEVFDADLAFIWRRLQGRDQLMPGEGLILEALKTTSYVDSSVLFVAFLVAEGDTYQDTFPVPFCSGEYTRPLEPIVVRISGLNHVYSVAMAVADV